MNSRRKLSKKILVEVIKPQLEIYVICLPSSYPGDFCFSGRSWRVITEVEAYGAADAVATYCGDAPTCHRERFAATNFPPALDVLRERKTDNWRLS
jgi:hypothetical protein